MDRFEVWGAEYDAADYCSGCPTTARKLGEVPLQPPPPGLSINVGPYEWRAETRPNRVYVFEVAAFSSRGAVNSKTWTTVEVWTADPPGSSTDFSATADDKSVRLFWSPPPVGVEIEIQRRDGPDGRWRTLDDQREGRLDLGVEYGGRYFYRARLVKTVGPSRVPGPWSSEPSVLVLDVTPPPPPSHLDAALSADGSVRLTWESRSDDPDLAGYRLYRRRGEFSGFEPIGGLLTTNVHVDFNPPLDQDLVYRVTAVDSSPQANESAPSPEATVHVESELVAPSEAAPERPVFEDPGL
jgi:hypothetical protein